MGWTQAPNLESFKIQSLFPQNWILIPSKNPKLRTGFEPDTNIMAWHYIRKRFFSLSNSLAYNVTWPLFVTKTIFCGKWRSKNGLRMLSMAKRLGSMSFNSACSLFYCIAAQNCTNLYQKYTYVLCREKIFHSYLYCISGNNFTLTHIISGKIAKTVA